MQNVKGLSATGGRPARRDLGIVLLALILLLAAGVRVAPLVLAPESQRGGLGQFADSFGYHRIAANLLQGHGFSATADGSAFGAARVPVPRYEPAVTRPPVYPYFLAAVYSFVGHPEDTSPGTWRRRWDAARLAQALFDAGLCLVIFFLVHSMAPRSTWARFAGAAVYAVSPYNVFYSRALLSETVGAFLLTVAVLTTVVAVVRGTMWRWAAAGVAMGFASLCLAQLMLFPAFIGAWLVVHSRRRGARLALALFAGFLVAISPWTFRNAVAFHRFIPIAVGATGWKVLEGSSETGSNWRGWGVVPEEVFPDAQERGEIRALVATLNTQLQTGDVRMAESDQVVWGYAMRALRRQPGRAVRAWLDGVPRLWYQNYIHKYRDREASGTFALLYLTFAAFALFRTRRDERAPMMPVVLLVLYLTLLFLPMSVEPRYSVVAMPALIGLAAIGLYRLVNTLRQPTLADSPT